jgi:HEXXH motif-containing protein
MTETFARAPGDVHEQLWSSLEPIEQLWEDGAAALVALRQALAGLSPRSAAADEFLRLYDFAAEQDPELFTACWRAPVALTWLRRCYDALGRTLHGEAPPGLLDERLEHWKALALGAALGSGETLALATPYRVELPFAVPGSGRVLIGAGAVAIRGARSGALELAGPAELVAAPVVEVGAARVELNPYALRGLGSDFPEVRPALRAGLAFHAESAELVRGALDAVRRFAPQSFEQLAALIRCIALKPAYDDDPSSNVSVSELPGAFVALRLGHPLDLGDTFVHEAHHNRLFCMEERAPLFEGEQELGADATRHYSPWREDPRPVRGILHAVYVTVPVAHYWREVLASGEARGPLAGYALDRARRSQLQLAIGTEQLARLARFTPAGQALFDELARGVAGVREALAAAGVPADPPAFYCTIGGEVKPERDAPDGPQLGVRAAVLRHMQKFDLAREASL